MTRKSKPAAPAGPFPVPNLPSLRADLLPGLLPGQLPGQIPGLRAGPTPPAPKPARKSAHLHGASPGKSGKPGKPGFARSVKPVPLPGKSRGR